MNEQFDTPETAKATQSIKLLAALREHRALTTTDCRDYLGMCHPAGRISELRASGVPIRTRIVWAADEQGRQHKQARYELQVQP